MTFSMTTSLHVLSVLVFFVVENNKFFGWLSTYVCLARYKTTSKNKTVENTGKKEKIQFNLYSETTQGK